MTKIIKTCLLCALLVALCAGCGGHSDGHADNPAQLPFAQAKAVVPSLLTTDQLVRLITADTVHNKVVFFFDACCPPCRHALRHELAAMYASRDTAQWRFYLVAGFNWLHRLVPDAEGNLVEDTLATFRHFAAQYKRLLPSLGYDTADLYFHYDPAWEHTQRGVFTPLAQRLFILPKEADLPFRLVHEGMPQLFKTDRHNVLYTDTLCVDSLEQDCYLAPDSDFAL